METNKAPLQLGFGKSLFLVLLAAAIIVGGKAVFKIDTTVVLLLSGLVTGVAAFLFGCSYDAIQDEIIAAFGRMSVAIMILLAIGCMVGAWIIAGTIPTMMYYGMRVINASFFLPFAFLFCLIMGLATGTSWGTISTVGIALIGISQGLGVPLPYCAGAIVSGAFMGDTLSPLSDAPLMAATSCDVPLMSHVRSSVLPAALAGAVALVGFIILGLQTSGGTIQGEAYEQILTVLPKTFNISPITLIPLVVVLALIFMKKPTLPTLAAGAATGVLIAVLFQGESLTASMAALSAGYTGDSGSAIVNALINRGGIQGMIGTVSIVIGATAFGAPLKASGAILTLLDRLHKSVKTQKQLMLLTAILHPIFFIISGAYYVSYSVIGGIMAPMYDNYGLKRNQLSTILGLTGITLAPLIPWCPAGAFVLSQLGIDTVEFLPFSFYSLAAPIVCFLFIFAGIGFARTKDKSVAQKS